MIRFEEPAIKVVMFKTEDAITTSLRGIGDYFTGSSENNTYINEDDYEMAHNPWA